MLEKYEGQKIIMYPELTLKEMWEKNSVQFKQDTIEERESMLTKEERTYKDKLFN